MVKQPTVSIAKLEMTTTDQPIAQREETKKLTAIRQKEHKYRKATSSLSLSDMIAKLERTLRPAKINQQQNHGLIVLQISRLSEGSTGQIFATSSVIYQMNMWGL